MEGEDDGDAHDGHVDGEAEVREEGPLVGAVIPRITGLVLKQQRAKEGPGKEGVVAFREARSDSPDLDRPANADRLERRAACRRQSETLLVDAGISHDAGLSVPVVSCVVL
jgi:hypothetical protein